MAYLLCQLAGWIEKIPLRSCNEDNFIQDPNRYEITTIFALKLQHFFITAKSKLQQICCNSEYAFTTNLL